MLLPPSPTLVVEVYRDDLVPFGAKDELDCIESCVLTPCLDEEAPEMLRLCEESVDPLPPCEMMDEVEEWGKKSSAVLLDEALLSLERGIS